MSKKTMSVPDAMWAAIDLNRAIRRVADAALKALDVCDVGTTSLQFIFQTREESNEMRTSLADLRRLKGEG